MANRKLAALAVTVLVVLSIVASVTVILPGTASAANQEACKTTLAQDDRVWSGSELASSCHILGGEPVEGALKIFVADGLLHVERYTGTGWIGQYYTYGGAVVRLDGQLYSLGYYNSQDDPSGVWGSLSQYVEPASQSRSGDTVTTVWTVGDARVEQRISYASDAAQFYNLEWDITNTGDANVSNVHFLRGADTYLAGDDFGNGTWNPDTGTVGVEKRIEGSLQTLVFQGVTDPTGFRSADYSTVIDDVEDGSLENSVVPEDHDNGYALEWNTSVLEAGETWQIEATESFVRSSLSLSGGDVVVLNDTSAKPTFSVENVAGTAKTVEFSVTCPDGWECQAPGSQTLDAGATSSVSPSVTPPPDADPGTYSVALTATSEASTPVQAVGQVEIPEPVETETDTEENGTGTEENQTVDIVDPDIDESEIDSETGGESDEADQAEDGDTGQEADETEDSTEEESEEDEAETEEEEETDDGTTSSGSASTVVTREEDASETQVTVSNAERGEPTTVDMPGESRVGEAGVESISVTPRVDGDFSMTVQQSPEPLDTSPEFQSAAGTTPLGYMSVDHSISNDEIAMATITYRVSEQRVEALNSRPAAVSLYRHEDTGWVEQPTEFVGRENGDIILQTTASGLSEWTAAAKRPRLNVTGTDVSVQAATTDEEVTIQVFVRNTGGTDGVYEAELLLNEETVDRTERTVPDGGTVAVNFERTFGQPGLYEVQVNDVFVGEVNISAADASVAVETAEPTEIQARDTGTDSDDQDAGDGGLPLLPIGVALVIVAGIGLWLYLARSGQ